MISGSTEILIILGIACIIALPIALTNNPISRRLLEDEKKRSN